MHKMSGVVFAKAIGFRKHFLPQLRRAEVTALACSWAKVL